MSIAHRVHRRCTSRAQRAVATSGILLCNLAAQHRSCADTLTVLIYKQMTPQQLLPLTITPCDVHDLGVYTDSKFNKLSRWVAIAMCCACRHLLRVGSLAGKSAKAQQMLPCVATPADAAPQHMFSNNSTCLGSHHHRHPDPTQSLTLSANLPLWSYRLQKNYNSIQL